MRNINTKFKILDDSGVTLVKTIGFLKNKNRINLGDILVGSVLKCKPNREIKKGNKVYFLIIRLKQVYSRKDASKIYFLDNAAILLTKEKKPIGSRFVGPTIYEIFKLNNLKANNLVNDII